MSNYKKIAIGLSTTAAISIFIVMFIQSSSYDLGRILGWIVGSLGVGIILYLLLLAVGWLINKVMR
jgi:hypothetical protein